MATRSDHRLGPPRAFELAYPYDWRYAAGATAAALLAWLLVVGVLALGPDDAGAMVRDLAVVVYQGDPAPYYTGLFSNLGVLVWAAGAGVLALAARASLPGRRRLALVHGVGAALTAFLVADDLLLLHDGFFPEYVGLSELVVQGAEALVAATWVLLSLRLLRADPSLPVLGVALVLLGCSVLTDVAGVHQPALEEGAKLAGIVAWSLWAWGTARWATGLAAQPVQRG